MLKKSKIYHFPVGDGDMTLLELASGDNYVRILCDMHIRASSDWNIEGFDETHYDVIAKLHELIDRDANDQPYVDALILTHPDEDHIRGYEKYFHTGSPEEYEASKDGEYDKIFVREMWSSPIIFKRKQKNHNLCTDAQAFNKEAKRRVKLYRDNGYIGSAGNRIRLIGEDRDGKTDDILSIVYKRGDTINRVNEVFLQELSVLVLAPLDDDDFPDDVDVDKNRSSVVLQWSVASHGRFLPTNFLLLAGDADVHVWNALAEKYEDNLDRLKYDLLIAPHHCSWHTLSEMSYSESDNPEVSELAVKALSQAQDGAVILSSSNVIKDDESDPPNWGAMKEYKSIAADADGEFKVLASHKPNAKKHPEVLVFRLTAEGLQEEEGSEKSGAEKKAIGLASITRNQIPHG
jgi:hypothetical protein